MSDPRLKDVTRNMVIALDALTGSPEAGRVLAAFYAITVDVTWSDLRKQYLDQANDLPDDPQWILSSNPEEQKIFLDRARTLHAVIEARSDPWASYLPVADANLWAPDSMAPGRWIDPQTLTDDRRAAVAQQTARRHLGHLERFEELDYQGMVEAFSEALGGVIEGATSRFAVGVLGYRGGEDQHWVLSITVDVGPDRVFLQLMLRPDATTSWGFHAYERSARTTSPSDLRARAALITAEDAHSLLLGGDQAQALIEEHACDPLTVDESAENEDGSDQVTEDETEASSE